MRKLLALSAIAVTLVATSTAHAKQAMSLRAYAGYCLASIIDVEGGWNPRAYNSSSGAYGLPQALPGSKMASAGRDWRTNPFTQIRWMRQYTRARYGSECSALRFRMAHGWY